MLSRIFGRKTVIVVDDEDREGDEDLVCGGSAVTPEIINFVATHCAASSVSR
jgi:3,4-dihydroxy-2-butanone 4-phosphate synthase